MYSLVAVHGHSLVVVCGDGLWWWNGWQTGALAPHGEIIITYNLRNNEGWEPTFFKTIK